MATDFELLGAWQGGDATAGSQLFRRHFTALFRFFSNKLDHGVEDLVQQTLLQCVKGQHRFRRDSEFRTFLFAIGKNVLYNEFRRRRRKDDKVDFATQSVMDLAPSPSRVVTDKVEQRLLLEALRSIPLDYQVALELYLWEDLSGPQLGEVLEISEAAVRSRLVRAKAALKSRLEQLEASPEHLDSTISNLEGWAAALRDEIGRKPKSA